MAAISFLQIFLENNCPFMHRSRQKAVIKVTQALPGTSRLTLTSLGRHLPGRCRQKNKIKCVDRLPGMGGEVADGGGKGLAGPPEQRRQADDGAARGGEDLRAMPFSDLAAVLLVRGSAHPVQAVIEAPVVPVELRQPLRPGLLRGEAGETEDRPGV